MLQYWKDIFRLPNAHFTWKETILGRGAESNLQVRYSFFFPFTLIWDFLTYDKGKLCVNHPRRLSGVLGPCSWDPSVMIFLGSGESSRNRECCANKMLISLLGLFIGFWAESFHMLGPLEGYFAREKIIGRQGFPSTQLDRFFSFNSSTRKLGKGHGLHPSFACDDE